MPADLHNFVESINYLFVKSPAGCVGTGFTAFIIDLLQKPRLAWVGPHAKTIGGPGAVTQEMVARCLSRMAGWVRLSLQCMDYEYPSWHLLLSFSVFDLCSLKAQRTSHGFGDAFSKRCFDRLALAFGGDSAELAAQYNDHVAFATAHYTKNEKEGFASAWAVALKRFAWWKPAAFSLNSLGLSTLCRHRHFF